MLKINRMIDLSQELFHLCPAPPAFKPPHFSLDAFDPRSGWKVERLDMNVHQGTHMDAPAHLSEFACTLDQYDVESFQGRMILLDCRGKAPQAPITAEDVSQVEHALGSDVIVLICTGWGSKRAWSEEYIYNAPYLSPEAAELLADRQLRGIGIDHCSIGGTGEENKETHRILLQAGIWIAEGLEIAVEMLSAGDWHIFALPLKIRDSSGAPARVVAVQYQTTT